MGTVLRSWDRLSRCRALSSSNSFVAVADFPARLLFRRSASFLEEKVASSVPQHRQSFALVSSIDEKALFSPLPGRITLSFFFCPRVIISTSRCHHQSLDLRSVVSRLPNPRSIFFFVPLLSVCLFLRCPSLMQVIFLKHCGDCFVEKQNPSIPIPMRVDFRLSSMRQTFSFFCSTSF